MTQPPNENAAITPQAAVNNLAAEMQRVLAMACEVDDAVGDLVELGENTKTPVALLQNVDLLRQSLGCIERFAQNLASQELTGPGICPDDLANGIYLNDMRLALTKTYHAQSAT